MEASIVVKSVTNEGVIGDGLVEKKGPAHMGVQEKLVGRANKEKNFINGQPVTALLDTGSQVTHVSHDFCLANGVEVHPLSKLINIEGTGGDSIEYIGYDEASLCLPMGSQDFNIEALLLVLPSTEYQRKVLVSIGTTITGIVMEFVNQNKPDHVSKSWKVLCCAIPSRKLVPAQPKLKRSIKTTKPIILPPFSTTIVKGSTKLKNQGMRLNLIAESLSGTQLPSGVQCSPTYFGAWLQPGCCRTEESVIMVHNNNITVCCRSATAGHHPEGTILWKAK